MSIEEKAVQEIQNILDSYNLTLSVNISNRDVVIRSKLPNSDDTCATLLKHKNPSLKGLYSR